MAKILVADDEPSILELVECTLSADGHVVSMARDGRKAAELAKKSAFDLVILDVMMPFMDGYHVASQLLEIPAPPPILLLTSRNFEDDQAAVKGCGASAFLAKPFHVGELRQVVDDLLKSVKR